MRSAAIASKSDSRTIRSRSMSGPATLTGASLADEIQVREAREHRLPADGRVLERDGDLLVAPRQLGRHDDPVTPATVADPVAIAVLAFAGNDRSRRPGRGRAGGGDRAA